MIYCISYTLHHRSTKDCYLLLENCYESIEYLEPTQEQCLSSGYGKLDIIQK